MKKEIKHAPVTSCGYTAYNTKTKKYHVGAHIGKQGVISPIWSTLPPDKSFLTTRYLATSMFNKKVWPSVVAVKVTTVTNSTTTIETVE